MTLTHLAWFRYHRETPRPCRPSALVQALRPLLQHGALTTFTLPTYCYISDRRLTSPKTSATYSSKVGASHRSCSKQNAMHQQNFLTSSHIVKSGIKSNGHDELLPEFGWKTRGETIEHGKRRYGLAMTVTFLGHQRRSIHVEITWVFRRVLRVVLWLKG